MEFHRIAEIDIDQMVRVFLPDDVRGLFHELRGMLEFRLVQVPLQQCGMAAERPDQTADIFEIRRFLLMRGNDEIYFAVAVVLLQKIQIFPAVVGRFLPEICPPAVPRGTPPRPDTEDVLTELFLHIPHETGQIRFAELPMVLKKAPGRRG